LDWGGGGERIGGPRTGGRDLGTLVAIWGVREIEMVVVRAGAAECRIQWKELGEGGVGVPIYRRFPGIFLTVSGGK